MGPAKCAKNYCEQNYRDLPIRGWPGDGARCQECRCSSPEARDRAGADQVPRRSGLACSWGCIGGSFIIGRGDAMRAFTAPAEESSLRRSSAQGRRYDRLDD